MKKKNTIILILLCMTVMVFFCSCGEKKKDVPKAAKNLISLYYLNAEEDGFKKIDYDLENGNDPEMASYEIISKLSDTETNNTDQYKASVYEGILVNSIKVQDGEETVDFGAGYNQLEPAKEILSRTAIVKSLLQVDGVDSVSFSVNGASLLGFDDTPVGAMKKNSFIISKDADEIYNDTKKVTLYYANKKGTRLKEVKKNIDIKDNIPLEQAVLEELIKTTGDRDLMSPLPEGLKINETKILDNICYVDLNSEIENAVAGVKEKITVYAMVNTITSLGTVSQVQFTVDGEKVGRINDFDSFANILSCDYSLCKK